MARNPRRNARTVFDAKRHIPHNAVSALTMRNFQFSGATDLFVFVSGYAAAILYGKMMLERGSDRATRTASQRNRTRASLA